MPQFLSAKIKNDTVFALMYQIVDNWGAQWYRLNSRGVHYVNYPLPLPQTRVPFKVTVRWDCILGDYSLTMRERGLNMWVTTSNTGGIQHNFMIVYDTRIRRQTLVLAGG